MAGQQRQTIWRNGYNLVTQALGLDQPVTTKAHTEKKYSERWVTNKYGGLLNVMGKQIGGQAAGGGPDVLKFIKQHDSDNSSGAVKESLDIMLKFQESLKSGDLMKNIQPIQSILGGGLYGKFKSAAAAATASEKVQAAKPPTAPPTVDIIAELIAAAMAMLTPDDAVVAADLLDSNEISLISAAYYGNGVYASIIEIPAFVDAINYLIPIFRATRGTV